VQKNSSKPRGKAGSLRRDRPGQALHPDEVECLGLCEVAPALFVNEDAHVNVTPEGLEKLLDGLK
jgi:NADH:ubiquinone oxidoreductase subunit E